MKTERISKVTRVVECAALVWISLFIIMAVMLLTSCDGDDDSEPPANSLSGKTWKVQSVSVDGVAKDDVYGDLLLNFTEQGYTSTNGSPIWKPTGIWTLATDKGSIEFDGELQAEFTQVSSTSFTMKFEWEDQTYSDGRTKSVRGEHEFTMVINP